MGNGERDWGERDLERSAQNEKKTAVNYGSVALHEPSSTLCAGTDRRKGEN